MTWKRIFVRGIHWWPMVTGGFSSHRASNTDIEYFLCCSTEQIFNKEWSCQWSEKPWSSYDITVMPCFKILLDLFGPFSSDIIHSALPFSLLFYWTHFEQRVELTVIWEAMMLMQHHCHAILQDIARSHRPFFSDIIVRRAGLLWSQQDFEWRWSVPLFKCLTVLEFSFILFDLCLLITFFNFIMNYVPIVTFWIFTYHKIWILSIMFCFIWSYWIIYFLACLEVSWRVVS